jgi:hypothetical protein
MRAKRPAETRREHESGLENVANESTDRERWGTAGEGKSRRSSSMRRKSEGIEDGGARSGWYERIDCKWRAAVERSPDWRSLARVAK